MKIIFLNSLFINQETNYQNKSPVEEADLDLANPILLFPMSNSV